MLEKKYLIAIMYANISESNKKKSKKKQKPKVRRKIVNIRAKIKKRKILSIYLFKKIIIQKINEIRSQFLKSSIKLINLSQTDQNKKENIQVTKTSNEKRAILKSLPKFQKL